MASILSISPEVFREVPSDILEMWNLYAGGMSMQRVGRACVPSISRQRVHQLFARWKLPRRRPGTVDYLVMEP